MERMKFLFCCIFLWLLVISSSYAININVSITSGATTRSFVIHAPGTSIAADLPVVFVYHGDGGTGVGIQSYTGFDAVADANNFMVVYPNAISGSWYRALGETIDVQFTSDMIDYLCTTYSINKQKVYASGHSAGGYMTYNLAASLANKIAAFAPVAGSMYGTASYNFNTYFGTASYVKVPIYHIHGDADNVVTYPDPNFTPDAWSEWPLWRFSYDNCGTNTYSSTSTIVSGVQRIVFCDGVAPGTKPVYLIGMIGGGHGWPSAAGYNPALAIWNFCNAFSITATSCVPVTATTIYAVNTTTAQTPISKLIYGINGKAINATDGYTSFRLGGSRYNSYNWENNASNAGADYFHHNDDYLCISNSVANCATPGAVLTSFVNTAKATNAYTVITLPNTGYVSADKNGTAVSVAETAPSSRFIPTQDVKGTAFSLTPNLSDNKVYVDEEVNFLVNQYGTAATTGVNGYSLTNEAGIWSTQIPRLHPNAATSVEVITKSKSLAKAIKNVDATAEVFGGNFYGFDEYYNMQGASDWAAIKAANPSYAWYVDYYLDHFKTESNLAGQRLLDVLSFHWYPEATGDQRIANANAYSTNDRLARLQAPRTLWDNNYTTYTNVAPYLTGENSYILQGYGATGWSGTNFFPLINKIKNSVNNFYPNTKIAFGEYNFGGGNDITGGLTQVDLLGIFGKYGIYYANYWDTYGETNFIAPAFRLYTNYDGTGKKYGANNVSITNTDVNNSSVYAAIDNNADVLHIIAINKKSTAIHASFPITSSVTYATAQVWQLDAASTSIVAKPTATVTANTLNYTLPAYSAIHFVVNKLSALPIQNIDLTGTVQNSIASFLSWHIQGSAAHLFEIEKSSDGIIFTKLHSINGNNNTQIHFNFTDDYAFANNAYLYYRIKHIEVDGSIRYSNIIKLQNNKRSNIIVQPNPVKSKMQVSLPYTTGQLIILNNLGQIVYQSTVTDYTMQLDVSFLSKGIYAIQFLKDNAMQSGKFVKE
jgi:poly(3-hydroxybutyrate) depolymerase